MTSTSHSFQVRTKGRSDFVDITADISSLVKEGDIHSGLCHVFVTHTTAGVTINEDADPDVVTDIIAALDRMVPWNGPYRHAEGNSAAHIKASIMGSSVTIPVMDGKLVLGTWQGVYFCEFDGPRTRTVIVTLTGDR